jgi:hypothetical protein
MRKDHRTLAIAPDLNMISIDDGHLVLFPAFIACSACFGLRKDYPGASRLLHTSVHHFPELEEEPPRVVANAHHSGNLAIVNPPEVVHDRLFVVDHRSRFDAVEGLKP